MTRRLSQKSLITLSAAGATNNMRDKEPMLAARIGDVRIHADDTVEARLAGLIAEAGFENMKVIGEVRERLETLMLGYVRSKRFESRAEEIVDAFYRAVFESEGQTEMIDAAAARADVKEEIERMYKARVEVIAREALDKALGEVRAKLLEALK